MRRLGKQCPGCVRRFKSRNLRGYGGLVRYTLKKVKDGLYECTRCGHREKR